MIINYEFVENELAPEMVLDLQFRFSTRRPSPVLLLFPDILFRYTKHRESLLKWEISNRLHRLLHGLPRIMASYFDWNDS